MENNEEAEWREDKGWVTGPGATCGDLRQYLFRPKISLFSLIFFSLFFPPHIRDVAGRILTVSGPYPE